MQRPKKDFDAMNAKLRENSLKNEPASVNILQMSWSHYKTQIQPLL